MMETRIFNIQTTAENVGRRQFKTLTAVMDNQIAAAV